MRRPVIITSSLTSLQNKIPKTPNEKWLDRINDALEIFLTKQNRDIKIRAILEPKNAQGEPLPFKARAYTFGANNRNYGLENLLHKAGWEPGIDYLCEKQGSTMSLALNVNTPKNLRKLYVRLRRAALVVRVFGAKSIADRVPSEHWPVGTIIENTDPALQQEFFSDVQQQRAWVDRNEWVGENATPESRDKDYLR